MPRIEVFYVSLSNTFAGLTVQEREIGMWLVHSRNSKKKAQSFFSSLHTSRAQVELGERGREIMSWKILEYFFSFSSEQIFEMTIYFKEFFKVFDR